MSELMDQAVIGMPYEMAMEGEVARRQFYSRAQSILAQAQALREEVAALRKDKERLDAIEGNCWDVRYDSSPNGDAGDSSISIEIIGHYQGNPTSACSARTTPKTCARPSTRP